MIDFSKLTVDATELTLGDVEILQDANATFKDQLDVMAKILPGINVREIRIADLGRLKQAVMDAVDKASNPLT